MGTSILPMMLIQGAQSAMNKFANAQMVDLQKDAQLELQKEQNQFQHDENELDRAWQEKTWLDHFVSENQEYANRLRLQQENWMSQFDATNAYNEPSAQMARLRAAGINPSAMMQNSGLASLGQSSASPSAASATAPNGVPFSSHGVSPASSASFGGLSSTAQMFTSVAQLGDAVSKLQQTGLNSERQKALLQAEVDKALAEASLNQQKSVLARIEAGVAENWLDKKAGAEYQKLVNDSYAAFTKGDLNKADELVAQANERLTSLQSEIMAGKYPLELANLQALKQVYDSERTRNIAQASAAFASAEQALSQADFNKEIAETERQIREGKVTSQVLSNAAQRIQNQLLRRENIRDVTTNEWQIWKILQECKRSGYATAEQLERWKIAVKDNDSYELRMILGEINTMVQAGATVAAPVAGARAMPAKPPVNVTRQFITIPNK